MDAEKLYRYLTEHWNLTRREALKHIALAFGSAAAAPLLAGCPPPVLRRDDVPINTVVCLMMENRSFDHFFGALRLVEGRLDVNGLTGAEFNNLPGGAPVSPFNLDVFCVADPPHGWSSGRQQLAGGANSGFISQYYPRVGNDLEAARVMGYHDRAQLPFYYGLADAFTLCDQWYCSVMGPTWPNRYYLLAAQSGGLMGNDFLPAPVTTIFDRLTAEGIPWRYYYADVPFIAVFADKLGEYGPNIKPVDQYYADAAAGTLPNVAFVDPSYAVADDHPPHHVQLGQGYVSSVFHALANGPHWNESLFVLTYDEWGGFYDHVPPPAAAPDERAAQGFNQYGFRVPTIVAGPYVKQGHVSNVLHDHTSVAAYLEWLWSLPPLTERDAAAATLVDTFDEARVLALDPRPVPALPDVIFDESTFSAFCIAEGLGELPLAFDKGLLPKEFDRRARIWETMGAVAAELEKHGKGGFRSRRG